MKMGLVLGFFSKDSWGLLVASRSEYSVDDDKTTANKSTVAKTPPPSYRQDAEELAPPSPLHISLPLTSTPTVPQASLPQPDIHQDQHTAYIFLRTTVRTPLFLSA